MITFHEFHSAIRLKIIFNKVAHQYSVQRYVCDSFSLLIKMSPSVPSFIASIVGNLFFLIPFLSPYFSLLWLPFSRFTYPIYLLYFPSFLFFKGLQTCNTYTNSLLRSMLYVVVSRFFFLLFTDSDCPILCPNVLHIHSVTGSDAYHVSITLHFLYALSVNPYSHISK